MGFTLGPKPKQKFYDNNGQPLSFGKIYTYNWDDRNPAPTYSDPAGNKERTNPIQLDGYGQPIGDGGMIYYEDALSYYIEIRRSDNSLVEGYPEPYVPGGTGGANVNTNIEYQNLFVNGQMQFFPIGVYEPVPNSIPILAYGGWSFRKNGTNINNRLEFKKFTLDDTSVATSPIYYLEYASIEPGSAETMCEVVYTVPNVRTLSNTTISVGIDMRTAVAGTYPIEVLAVQNFGSGGSPSPSVETQLGSFNPATNFDNYNGSAVLPNLIGKTLGSNKDDALEIIFRLPLNMACQIQITNFYLKVGNAVESYPFQTTGEVELEVKAYELPKASTYTDYDTDATDFSGEQAYNNLTLIPREGVLVQAYAPALPIGGSIVWSTRTPPAGFILAKGQALFKSGKFNRLYNVPDDEGKVFGEMNGYPGDNVVAVHMENTEYFDAISQTAGPANALFSTGNTLFNFLRVCEGVSNLAIHHDDLNTNYPTVRFQNSANGTFSPPVETNTVMALNVISNGSASTPADWEILAQPASVLNGGEYVRYYTTTGTYYVYFVINGIGNDPLIGGTGRPVNLRGDESDIAIGTILYHAIPGFERGSFQTTPANQLKPGEYIQVSSSSQNYAVYVRIDGSRNAPTIANYINVPVDVLLTDTSNQVAQKFYDAINPLLWYMPDWRGLFMRIWDDGGGHDPDASTRSARADGVGGDVPMTKQGYEVQSHNHAPLHLGTAGAGELVSIFNSPDAANTIPFEGNSTISNTGGAETRPKNFYATLAYRY